MLKRITLRALLLPAFCLPVAAQESPAPNPPPKEAAAGAETPKAEAPKETPKVIEAAEATPEEVKVLKPVDVPAERMRIKSKADIKCEVTLTPSHGREVTVKGVVVNGKLIERFAGRVFVEDPTVESPQCGVRLWWVDNTAGWIFLRYSQIRTIALTGVLTAVEREEIMKRLKAREDQKKEADKALEAAKLEEELVKMSAPELEAYLLREYPLEQGWNHGKLRDLKKKQLIDNQPLTRQESIFVTYFNQLIKARLTELKHEKDKIEIEPGSADKPSDPARAHAGNAGSRPAQGGRSGNGESEPGPGAESGSGGNEPGDAGVPPAGGSGAEDEEAPPEDDGAGSEDK